MLSPLSEEKAANSCVDLVDVNSLYNEHVTNVRNEYLSGSQTFPWIVGFSGGKDSTLVAHLVFSALLDVSPSRQLRPVHIVANDTLVESPLVVTHLHQCTVVELAAVRAQAANPTCPYRPQAS